MPCLKLACVSFHRYFTSDDERAVLIPGASYLVLEFDPRCDTERRRDYLSLTAPGMVMTSLLFNSAAPLCCIRWCVRRRWHPDCGSTQR